MSQSEERFFPFENIWEAKRSDNTEGETEIVGVRGDFVAHVRRNY